MHKALFSDPGRRINTAGRVSIACRGSKQEGVAASVLQGEGQAAADNHYSLLRCTPRCSLLLTLFIKIRLGTTEAYLDRVARAKSIPSIFQLNFPRSEHERFRDKHPDSELLVPL